MRAFVASAVTGTGIAVHMRTMTSTLGTYVPPNPFIADDLESDEFAAGVGGGPGLQLPDLDVDTERFSWPSHAEVGLPPGPPLEPSDRLGTDHPVVPVELKRNRRALRGKPDADLPHDGAPAATSDPAAAEALPTRRSLREGRVGPVTSALRTVPAPAAPEAPAQQDINLELATDLEAALTAAFESEEAQVATAAAAPVAEVTPAAEPAAPVNPVVAAAPAVPEAVVTPAPAEVDAAPAPAVADPVRADLNAAYVAKIKSYGPFPVMAAVHRDFRPVLILSVLFGVLGADRFYEGKYLSGALKLVTAGGLGIWWIADIIALLTGRAADRLGHHYEGSRRDRTIAWVLAAVLFAGLGAAAVNAVAPAVTSATTSAKEVLLPAPEPTPVWKRLADVNGTEEPVALAVTGSMLRFTYDFTAPVFAYLQKDGDTELPAEPLLLQDSPANGVQEVPVEPGQYSLVIRTEGNDWTLTVEDYVTGE